MSNESSAVRLSLSISPELNERLEQIATANHTTKSEILRKAFALFDVAYEAKMQKKRLGILDQDKHLETEIIGF